MSSFPNPSGLRIGTDGTLSGIHFRVVGRVMLSTTADGETYFWQEFNLHEDTGRQATLVLEEGDNGPEWKLFMAFEPSQPLSAAEASSRQVGDAVNLEGRPVQITYIGQSRVVWIEGQAPEGVEVGDVADYFNADEGARMLVVSWTGDEIEYYRGMDVSTEEVRTAFGLPSLPPGIGDSAALASTEPETTSSPRSFLILVSLLIFAGVGVAAYLGWSRGGWNSGDPKIASRVERLAVGKSGLVDGKHVSIAGHSEVEIHRTGSRSTWHEYNLRDVDGNSLLLVGGLSAGANAWVLFRPVQGDLLTSPMNAAALRGGDALALEGRSLRISELFQCRFVNREGQTQSAAEFGFIARSEEEQALVRWSQTQIEFYLGKKVATKEVESALTSKQQ